jgi:zeaxanthin glucosyltransferase
MHHFGLICPPGISHVTGLTGIARELCRRGHRATVFNILDVEEAAKREGMGFHPLGQEHHPKGSFQKFADEFGRKHGLEALRFGLKAAREEIKMLLQEAPEAMRAEGVTALLIDQGQPAGSTIAERLSLPFITICNAVPCDPDPNVPPTDSRGGPARSWIDRLMNRAAWRLMDLGMTPLRRTINGYRTGWGMKPLRSLYDTFSPILELAQETSDFDFQHAKLPPHFYYIGLIDRSRSSAIPFPYERLDGRPLIYGSLGTVAKDGEGVFRMLAEACEKLNVQLVITLGGKLADERHKAFPGSPIVVAYAPQLELLKRATVTICHAGNNTVLESLASGVPVVAVPMNTDQYGVAARLQHSGAGERIELKQISAKRFFESLDRILSQPAYKQRAQALSASLKQAGGEVRAADLIEQRLREGLEVSHHE